MKASVPAKITALCAMILLVLLSAAGCSGRSSITAPLYPGQSTLIAVRSYSIKKETVTDETLTTPTLHLPATEENKLFTTPLSGEHTRLYYQLPSLVAEVWLISDYEEAALRTDPPSLAPFLPESWSSLTFSTAEDDEFIYHATISDGKQTINVRFALSAELTGNGIRLYAGQTFPLQCTPEDFAAALVQLDIPALLASLSVQ